MYSRGKGMILRMSAVIEVMLQMFAWETHVGDIGNESGISSCGDDGVLDNSNAGGDRIDGNEGGSSGDGDRIDGNEGGSSGGDGDRIDGNEGGSSGGDGDRIDGNEGGSSGGDGDRIDGNEGGSSGGDGDRIVDGNDSEDEATLISKLAMEIAYNLVNVSFNQLCK